MGDLRYRVVKRQITRDIKDLKTGDESTIEDLIAGSSGGDITPEQVKTLYESNADTNAYTDVEKTKLNGIASGAQVNVGTTITQGSRSANAVEIASSTGAGGTLEPASTTKAGVMTSADKVKLNGIATNANNYVLPSPTTTAMGGLLSVATPAVVVADPLDVVQVQANFDAIIDALKAAGVFVDP